MVKYHVNSQGLPSICRATQRICPFGGKSGAENHFDTKEEATAFAQQKMEEEFQKMPVINPVEESSLEDKLRKAKNGEDVETLAQDESKSVRLELAKRGLASDILSKDKSPLVARYGQASVNAKEVSVFYEGYGKNKEDIVVFVYGNGEIKIMSDSFEVNKVRDLEEIMEFDRSYYQSTSKLEMKKIKRNIEKVLEKHNYQE